MHNTRALETSQQNQMQSFNNVISYTCAFPHMTCQKLCCGIDLFESLNKSEMWADDSEVWYQAKITAQEVKQVKTFC